MAIRFRRTVKIAPGVRLNVGKKSASVRVGGKGFGVTSGTAGTRVSAGIPGTGVYATKKISGSSKARTTTGSKLAATGAAPSEISLKEAVTALTPVEKGFSYPGWWLAGAIFCVLSTFNGMPGALLFAIPCGYMVWRRLSSARYKALKSIRAAQKQPSTDSDESVRELVSQAKDSWTVQKEAGLYFAARENPEWAVGYLGRAINLLPGDRRALTAITAPLAIDAGQLDYAVSLLEPYVQTATPDDSELDAILLSTLALAHQKRGDAGRALEVVNRLPLRRRNLDQPLLLGLCVRALAKHSLGKNADAKRDIDRVYATDPGFPFLKDVQKTVGTAV